MVVDGLMYGLNELLFEECVVLWFFFNHYSN